MQLKIILNRVQKIKSFVYGAGSLGGGRTPLRLWKWNCILGPIPGRCARAVSRAARGLNSRRLMPVAQVTR